MSADRDALDAYREALNDQRLGRPERIVYPAVIRRGRVGDLTKLAGETGLTADRLTLALATLTRLGYLQPATINPQGQLHDSHAA